VTDRQPILWLDLETTDLDPTHGRIVEIAAAITDAETLTYVGDAYHQLVDPGRDILTALAEPHGRVDPAIVAMHHQSGLTTDLINQFGATAPGTPVAGGGGGLLAYFDGLAAVETSLCRWLERNLEGAAHQGGGLAWWPADRLPWLGGSGPHFDRRWIDEHMPALGGRLHYRNFDVSTLRRAFDRWAGADLAGGAPPHRAGSDVVWAIEQARAARRLLTDGAAG